MPAVLNKAKEFNLDEDKVVLDRTVLVPGFTLARYKMLRHSQLSIISSNCWGGLLYHLFELQFTSPTVNMYIGNYMKLISNPHYYFDKELRFVKMMDAEFNDYKWKHPVFALGDVTLYMNHFYDPEVAREKWETRLIKLNWYNTLVEGSAGNEEALAEFDQLPYGKKVCFVDFKTDLPSGYYIPPKFVRGRPFWMAINDTSNNLVQCFDMWDMLLYGKKTPLNI